MLACPDRVRGASVEQQPESVINLGLEKKQACLSVCREKKTQAGLGRVEADACCETPISRREPFAFVV